MFLINTRLSKDDLDSTILSFKEEKEIEAKEGLDQTFEILVIKLSKTPSDLMNNDPKDDEAS